MSKAGGAAPNIRFSASAGEVAMLAARDLASGLAAMLGIEVSSSADASLAPTEIRIDLGNSTVLLHLQSASKVTVSMSRAAQNRY